MSTITVNSTKIIFLSIVSLFKGIEIDEAYNAVMIRSQATTLEEHIQRIKDECDEYLNNEFGDQKRITTSDNKYTVVRVLNNRGQYRPTILYRLAKRFMKWVESITPKEVGPVGKGYYYKAGK